MDIRKNKGKERRGRRGKEEKVKTGSFRIHQILIMLYRQRRTFHFET